MRSLLLALTLLFAVQLQAQKSYEEGQLLLLLQPKSTLSQLSDDFRTQFGTALKEERRLAQSMPLYLVSFDPSVVNTEAALTYAARSEQVSIAQLNHKNVELRLTPNDPQFDEQWHLYNDGTNGGSGTADMDALNAWDIATGGLTPGGDTIVVAVIDGGYNLNHPDLVENIFINRAEIPGNFIDDDNNGYVDDVSGWNVYNNSGSHFNDNHGNHVAGIIGARGDNNEGVAGVNWNVKILPISGSSTNDATVAAAYGYVLDMRKRYDQTNGVEGAYVVSTNSSFGVDFGDPQDYPLWCAMYDSLGYAGIISAGATANANYNIDQVGDVPTACPSNFLLSVTNTTSNDTKNSNAAYGLTTIDLGAPGTSIYSTFVNGYGDFTGTSMATPQVAGAVALMYNALCSEVWQAYASNPAGLALYIKNKLLTEGVDPIAALSSNTTSGGRLDLFKAVSSVSDSCFAAVLDVTNTSCGSCNGAIDLTVVGGVAPYTYLWSNGSSNALGLDSLCAGQYGVTVMDALGDSALASTSISDSAGPLVALDVADVSCNGGANGQVTLTGAQAYIWPDGETSSTRSDLEAGTYYVSATENGNPCTTVVAVTVMEPEALVASFTSAVPDPLTASNGGLSVLVSGGTPPYAYEWSTGATTATLNDLPIGQYSITITDAKGCEEQQGVFLGYPAGIHALSTNGIQLYPNPAAEKLFVRYSDGGGAMGILYDMSGRELARATFSNGIGFMDLSTFSDGSYVMLVRTSNTVYRQVVQHRK